MILALLWACVPSIPLPDLGEVPAFTLLDQSGATVTRESLAGDVWVVNFIFTSCPDVCPVLSTHMTEVQKHYTGRDGLRLVSFSVDPLTDTPPVLAAYGRRFDADPARWSFLTGETTAVRALVVDGFKNLMETVPATGVEPETVLHGSRFVVVDRQSHIRAYPDPAKPGKAELYAAIDAALRE